VAVETSGSSNAGPSVLVFTGDGNGMLTLRSSMSLGTAPSFDILLAAGDVNTDGALDLVTAVGTGAGNLSDVVVLQGNGDGTFQSSQTVASYLDLTQISLGDLNGDGHLDIVVLYQSAFQVLLGQGDGSFKLGRQYFLPWSYPVGLALGDINQDGISDVVVTGNLLYDVQYFIGLGDGTFDKGKDTGTPSVWGLGLADLNSDNRIDIIGADLTGGSTIAMSMTGGFNVPVQIPYPAQGTEVVIDDFNGDGRLDFEEGPNSIYLATSVDVSPTSLSFPATGVGIASQPLQVIVTNNGPSGVGIGALTFSGSSPDDFRQSNDCAVRLPAHSTCSVEVTFVPTNDLVRAAILNILDSNGTHSLLLTGTGADSAPVVKLSSQALNWPTVPLGQSGATASVKVTNIGNANLTGLAVSLTGSNTSEFEITNNTCGTIGKPGGSCSVSIVFMPTSTGVQTATLAFTDNAYGSPQLVLLTGTGQMN